MSRVAFWFVILHQKLYNIIMIKPIVILHQAQLGENIGMSARAMGNCGLETLRLSTPRANWDRAKARAAAAGAAEIIDDLTVHDSLSDALADCTRVFATSARRRNMPVRVIAPETAAQEMLNCSGKVALLFGAESSGLDNDAISLADAMIEIPLNPACTSLNLSQAVLLVAYSWWRKSLQDTPENDSSREPAPRAETAYLLARLEDLLEEKGFFTEPKLREVSWRKIQAMIHQSGFNTHEIQTWHGIFSALIRHEKVSK